ncbi:MAG: adenylate/guanylate cyclase domain-containing protein [Desulfarculales bacterium]|nr:adenylate/guanylate cyclase domain-containing protein [Desulfarculales bacterium]
MKNSLRLSHLATVAAGGVLTAAMLILYITQPPLLARLDLKVYDSLLPLRAAPSPSPVPAIIDLDEASLAQYGQWPWPRYLMADLLQILAEYEVAAIGLDIMLSEPDRSSPDHMRAYLKRDKSVSLDFVGLPPELYDYDRLLARTLKEIPAVLGAYASFAGSERISAVSDNPPPPSVSLIERELPGAVDYKPLMPSASNAVLPLPELRSAAPLGFVNVASDLDGIVRETPLVIRLNDRIYPSLALRSLMLGLNLSNITAQAGPYGLETIRIGRYAVPVSPQGAMRVPFLGPRRTYPYFSAGEILRRGVSPDHLRGRIVFVGTSAPGLLDIRATPLDQFYPGVEVHAAALDAMLTGNAIRIPPWTPALQVLGIALTGILSTVLFGFSRPRIYLPAVIALIAAAIIISRRLFSAGIFVSPLYFVLTAAMLGAFLLLLRFWQEEQQKLHLRGVFSRYVSPEVVKRITKTRGDLFAGEERDLSIMFTDIRGFTSISEKLSPQQIVALLNRYFTPMTALVLEHGGTMDKFIGDALMAFWNAPLEVAEHQIKAVETALLMQERLVLLNEDLRAEFGVDIRIGAGVHSGPAYVGNMGSRDMVNYTLIGDSVNLASRLEGLCPHYGVGAVVSADTMRACGDAFAFRYLDTIRVKGKIRPVPVYNPLRREEAARQREEMETWEETHACYRAGHFSRAAEMAEALRGQFPESKLYSLYAGRARELAANPPPDWDGVWIMAGK